MMKRISGRSRIKVLIVALVALLVIPFTAYASLMCRSDPVVILSNGMTLDIGASISTLPWQVTEVHYELHVPRGVSLILAIHTPTWLTSQETFTLIADQPARSYNVVTTVRTNVGNATVSADTILVSALRLRLGGYSATGMEGQRLSVSFRG